MFYKTVYNSPLGVLTLASDGTNLSGVWLAGQKYFPSSVDSEMVGNACLEIFRDTKI